MTARKLNALTRTRRRSPTAPMVRPAIAGPTTRAPLNMAELSATALPMSSRPTISIANAWRTGMSTAFAQPSRSGEHQDDRDGRESGDRQDREDRGEGHHQAWTTISVGRLGSVSATMPANSPKIITGMNWAAATTPSQIGSP